MDKPPPPPARFQRFEKVGLPAGGYGTVVWCDPPCYNRRTGAFAEWAYSVYLPSEDRYRSFRESNLYPTGESEPESAYFGRICEISFDSVMGSDMAGVEGCYRTPGVFWQVYTFSKEDVPDVIHRSNIWESGIKGVEFEIPEATTLDEGFVIRTMTAVLGGGPWVVVSGPDSLVLK